LFFSFFKFKLFKTKQIIGANNYLNTFLIVNIDLNNLLIIYKILIYLNKRSKNGWNQRELYRKSGIN